MLESRHLFTLALLPVSSEPTPDSTTSPLSPTPRPAGSSPKLPRVVLPTDRPTDDATHSPTVFAFPPNRDTLGATAYLIVEEVNILVDCPAWEEANQRFLQAQGGVDWLFLTHRGGMGKVRQIQQALGCRVLVQEQEAYLLPEVDVTAFHRDFTLTPHSRVIWTPGHSPGSACLYYDGLGGVLFSGRHLLPDPQGQLRPLKTAKTFHWRRQLQSVQSLQAAFSAETLQVICPGANTGFLRGKLAIDQAYGRLTQIDAGLPTD